MIEVYDGIAYFSDDACEHQIGDIDAVRSLIADLNSWLESGVLCELCSACGGTGYRRGAIPRVYKSDDRGRIVDGPYDPGCEACGGALDRKGSGRVGQ